MGVFKKLIFVAAIVLGASQAQAGGTCGNDASGFEAWKASFGPQAKVSGVPCMGRWDCTQ